jgi:surface antigen
MDIKSLVCVGLSVVMLSACTEQERANIGTKEAVGTIIGAGTGAYLGSKVGGGSGRTVAIAMGTLLGAGLGNSIGTSLDNADRAAMGQTSQQALERGRTGESYEWNNPDSGNYGTFTPTKTYQTASGQNCREYTQDVYVGGQRQQAYGTACRDGNGNWQIVN